MLNLSTPLTISFPSLLTRTRDAGSFEPSSSGSSFALSLGSAALAPLAVVRLVPARDVPGAVRDDTAGRTGGRAAGRVVVREVAPRADTKIKVTAIYLDVGSEIRNYR